MGKTCVACGTSFFSPDDSDKCGKCREKMAQEGHEEHSGCGCGHSHYFLYFFKILSKPENVLFAQSLYFSNFLLTLAILGAGPR